MTGRHAAVAALLPLALALPGCTGTAPESSPRPTTGSASAGSTSASPSAGSATRPSEPAGTRLAVEISGNRSSVTGRVTVPLGDQVTVALTSDRPDEVHLHGYDLTVPVVPGTPAELSFEATIPGVFELELHEAGTVLFTLQIG